MPEIEIQTEPVKITARRKFYYPEAQKKYKEKMKELYGTTYTEKQKEYLRRYREKIKIKISFLKI